MLHDPIHKLLCSYPRVIADILRGYVRGKLVERLDLSTLEQVGSEHVSDGLQRRISDAVWRVRRDDRRWVWVYLVLEFQSRPDPGMSLRMLVYVVLQYLDLQRKLGSGKLVPAVLGCVLYNGEDDWVEWLETRPRIDLELKSGVEEMLPKVLNATLFRLEFFGLFRPQPDTRRPKGRRTGKHYCEKKQASWAEDGMVVTAVHGRWGSSSPTLPGPP